MIDESVRPEWPSEVTQALPRFRQGTLVENPPLIYAACPPYWLWAASQSTEEPPPEEDIVAAEGVPKFGIITTQTCDLDEQRPRPRQPWFQVAPVYDIAGTRRDVQRPLPIFMVELDPIGLPPGTWVGDLRIDIPIEKSWLVGKVALPGFRTEDGYRAFSDRLAHRVGRPYLGNVVVTVVDEPLGDITDQLAGEGQLTGVAQVRATVAGDPDAPQTVEILVLSDGAPLSATARDALDDWWLLAREAAATASPSFELLPIRYELLTELSAAEFLRSVLLYDYRLR